jgi:REP element-mobilizing transposase RayT
VVAQGNDRQRVVLDDVDRSALLVRLATVAARTGWSCEAYCLLDTHLHLVVRTVEATLGRGMGLLLGGHARRFNVRHGREGHVWGQRYHASLIDAESYLVAACTYVVLNPVRAGLCRHPAEWRWCSFGGTAGLVRTPPQLRGDLLLATFDADPAAARRIYRARIDEEAANACAPRATAVPG